MRPRCILQNSVPSMILAQISAPTPNCGQPPSMVTRWFVLTTLASTVSTSMGRMVRRFITWVGWGGKKGCEPCCDLGLPGTVASARCPLALSSTQTLKTRLEVNKTSNFLFWQRLCGTDSGGSWKIPDG